MNRNKKWIIIITLIVIALGAQWFFGNKRDKSLLNKFYEANLNGKLVKIESDQGTTVIMFKDNKEFTFLPKGKYNGQYFADIASPGDSVCKPFKSDTLKLIHKGKKYTFTFEKID